MNNEISKSFSSVTKTFAAIIPDTPIVSIAGSTLSKITTTTTSTSTTPTPEIIEREQQQQKHQASTRTDDTILSSPMSDAAAAKTPGAAATSAAAGAATGAFRKELTPPQSRKTANDASTANYNDQKEVDSWEESRLKDWDDTRLKKLLDEAYSYKNPRDKENKSQIFLQLLQKAENEKEDQPFSFRAIASRFTRNSSSTTSNSNHNHNHHNHHQIKQGGSLQDLVDAVRNESLVDCDYNYVGGGQRNRRHNHNSRQKKYSSSVSSRQREGGSLPSNVNVTNYGSLLGAGQPDTHALFMPDIKLPFANSSGNTNSTSKLQRRNVKTASKETDKDGNITDSFSVDAKASDTQERSDSGSAFHSAGSSNNSGDFVIQVDEPLLDIQQQQKLRQSKADDDLPQNLHYYDRLDSVNMRIPRATILNSLDAKVDFASTSSPSYVDESVRFPALDRAGSYASTTGTIGLPTGVSKCGKTVSSSTIDSKYLPLDENYKSCKSLLGGDVGKSTSNKMFSTTKTITRQFDENGNSLYEMYQGAQAAAVIMNTNTASMSAASSLVSGATTLGQSQAKAKNKKKSQQERNTKTVDVKLVAGYRGHDPVDLLVKYIENTEDKQGDTRNSKNNENSKKKDRKKDKEKQKIKKSNSLEELRSCSKMEVDELKHTAATTESNVMLRNKGGAKGGKNNSLSTVDINKNFDCGNSKDMIQSNCKVLAAGCGNAAATSTVAVLTASNRKGERRSWGIEELQYLGVSNASGEDKDKTKDKKNKCKEKESTIATNEKEVIPGKESKDKSITEKNDRSGDVENTVVVVGVDKLEKIERSDKFDKSDRADKSEKPEKLEKEKLEKDKPERSEKRKKSESNLQSPSSIVDLLALNSLVPETAEFHVVTKKKKAKKQRVPSTDDSGSNAMNSSIGFNRSHNLFFSSIQKTSTGAGFTGSAQNQQQNRFKYYNSQYNNSERHDYLGSGHHYSNTSSTNNTNNHSNHYNQPLNSHQAHNITTSGDKSRRKSTSSVPPSDKSDSSDLDSVHSLPIESSSASTKSKQRLKSTSAASASVPTTGSIHKITVPNPSAPISYADITRTNKELSVKSSSSVTEKWPLIENTANTFVDPLASTCITDDSQIPHATAQVVTNSANTFNSTNSSKPKSSKKSAVKPDFPDLVSTPLAATQATMLTDVNSTTKTNQVKTISYSQSLTSAISSVAIANNSELRPVMTLTNTQTPTSMQMQSQTYTQMQAPMAVQVQSQTAMQMPTPTPTSMALPTQNVPSNVPVTDVKDIKSKLPEKRSVATEITKADIAAGNVGVLRQQQLVQQQQQQPQQKTQQQKPVYQQQQPQHQHHQQQKHQLQNQPLQQQKQPPQQQQMLQKSRSVEHEGYSCHSNMDQQYPALEKTVKRHSTSNVSTTILTGGILPKFTSPPPTVTMAAQLQFNFAAAAKQQTTTNSDATLKTNAPASMPVTIATTTSNNTAAAAVTNSITSTLPSNNTLKISKDKSPITTVNTNSSTNSPHNTVSVPITFVHDAADPLSNTNAIGSSTLTRKGRKDRQVQQQQIGNSLSTSATDLCGIGNSTPPSTTTPTPTQKSSPIASVKFGSTGSVPATNANFNAKHQKSSVHINPKHSSVALPVSNRPAVIILNDDRKADRSNEFTFGDFNAEELRFFGDEGIDQSQEESISGIQSDSSSNIAAVAQKSKVSPTVASQTNFNDSGASPDVVNNSTQYSDDFSVDAYSPNTSFVTANHCCNQSTDSGIYTNSIISTNNNNKNYNNFNHSNSNKPKNGSKTKSISPSKDVSNKLNTFLSAPSFVNAAVANASVGDKKKSAYSKLETCNDIETAIIAAARAAAEKQNSQQKPLKNTNSSPNVSSLSSSSSFLVESKLPPKATSFVARFGGADDNEEYTYADEVEAEEDAGENISDTISDNSDGSQDSFVPPKEIDIHFIPPTKLDPTTTLQNNDIIVDFIGSAWEEVANSQVTEFYDE